MDLRKLKPGTAAMIKTNDEEYQGIIMPRPEILDKDKIIIKLDSGYNIGIENSRIIDFKILGRQEPPKQQQKKLRHNPNLPKVAVLSYGGTISSKIDYSTGGVYADYTAEDFLEMIPELKDIANLEAKKLNSVMSEDMTPKDWEDIVNSLKPYLEDDSFKGIVLTQGTDALHYTSSALSFMIQGLNKPIIITASQRSIDRGSSDAFMNLKCAIKAATKDIGEVVVVMHGSISDDYCLILRGNKVRKMHSSRRDAFKPINARAIAKVSEHGDIEFMGDYIKTGEKNLDITEKIEHKVGMVYFYPGIKAEQLDAFKDYRGLVIVGTGLGNVPQNMFTKIQELIDNKVSVVITTQTLYGATNPLVYQNLRMLSIRIKAIFVGDLLPEAAFAKLCWALGKADNPDEVKALMQKNVANEFTDRLSADMFLNKE